MFVAERLSRSQNRLPSPACRDAQRWFTTTSNIGTISCRGWLSSNSGWIFHHNLHPKLWNFANPCDVQSLDLCCRPACSCILWINCWRSWPRWLDALTHCVNIVSKNPSLCFFILRFCALLSLCILIYFSSWLKPSPCTFSFQAFASPYFVALCESFVVFA